MRRALWLVPPAIALAMAFVSLPPSWVETWYSRGAYLVLERRLTTWTNAVPIATTDTLIVIGLVSAILAIRGWLRRSRGGPAREAAGRAVVGLTTTASAIYVAFVMMWGLNYGREPLRARLDFDVARVTPDAVRVFARERIERVNMLHGPAHAAGWASWETLPAVLGEGFERVQRQLADVRPAVPGVPKWSMLTFYFERAGVSGMTNPFALEVVVDRSQLPFERPFVAAHEWAHLAGYAREDEASFIGWLVCLQGPPGAKYSAELAALVVAVDSMPIGDGISILRAIGPGPRRDLQAVAERSARMWPWLRRPTWWLYDRYLRANRVEQGVRTYGQALELMVGTRRDEQGRVVRRRKMESGIQNPEDRR
jgi:hypothetical protein